MADSCHCAHSRPLGALTTRIYCSSRSSTPHDLASLWRNRDQLPAHEPYITGVCKAIDQEPDEIAASPKADATLSPIYREPSVKRQGSSGNSDLKRRRFSSDVCLDTPVRSLAPVVIEGQTGENGFAPACETRGFVADTLPEDSFGGSHPLTESSPVRSFAAAVGEVLGADEMSPMRESSFQRTDTLPHIASAPETPNVLLGNNHTDDQPSPSDATPACTATPKDPSPGPGLRLSPTEPSIVDSVFKAPLSVQRRTAPSCRANAADGKSYETYATPGAAPRFSLGEWSPSFETQPTSASGNFISTQHEEDSQLFSQDDQALITPIRRDSADTPLAAHTDTQSIGYYMPMTAQSCDLRRLDWSPLQDQQAANNYSDKHIANDNHAESSTIPLLPVSDSSANKAQEQHPHLQRLEHTPMLVPPTPTTDDRVYHPLVTPMVTRNRVDMEEFIAHPDASGENSTPVLSAFDISSNESLLNCISTETIDKTQILTRAVLMEHFPRTSNTAQQDVPCGVNDSESTLCGGMVECDETPDLLARCPLRIRELGGGCAAADTPNTTDLLRYSENTAVNVSNQSSSGGPLAKVLFRESMNIISVGGGRLPPQGAEQSQSEQNLNDAKQDWGESAVTGHLSQTDAQDQFGTMASPELIETSSAETRPMPPPSPIAQNSEDITLNTQALADEATAMLDDLTNTAASALFEDICPSISKATADSESVEQSGESFSSQILAECAALTPHERLQEKPNVDLNRLTSNQENILSSHSHIETISKQSQRQPKSVSPSATVDLSAPFSAAHSRCDDDTKNDNANSVNMPSILATTDASAHAVESDMPAVGFQTASGKKVTISAQSMVMAHRLFDEGSIQPSSTSKEQILTVPPMDYQTASGKKVGISAQALADAQRLFDEPGDVQVPNTSTASYAALGFQTASGKKVDISDIAITKAQRMFAQDESDDPSLPTNVARTANRTSLPKASLASFKTAPGHKESASAATIAHAEKSLYVDDVCVGDSSKYDTAVLPSVVGFQTASGAKVDISVEALAKAHALFADDMALSNDAPSPPPPPPVVGFQTASGAKVDISAESLAKARALFADDMAITSDAPPPPPVLGFQTTSGTKVDISVKALAKAQALFTDAMAISNDAPPPPPILGFQTASGTKAESLAKAQALFTDDMVNPNPPVVGFQTASGAKVDISVKALAKAQARFADDMALSNDAPPPPPPLQVLGFQTARGAKVDISDSSLAKACSLFELDTTEQQNGEHPALVSDSTPSRMDQIAPMVALSTDQDTNNPYNRSYVPESAIKTGHAMDNGAKNASQHQRPGQSAVRKSRPFKPLVPKTTPSATVPTPSTTPLTNEPKSSIATVPRSSPKRGMVRDPTSVLSDRILHTKSNPPTPLLSTPAAVAPGAGPASTPVATPLIYRLKGRKPPTGTSMGMAQTPDVPFFRTPKPVVPRVKSAPNTTDSSWAKPAGVSNRPYSNVNVRSTPMSLDAKKSESQQNGVSSVRLTLREFAARNGMKTPSRGSAAAIMAGVPRRICVVTCSSAVDFRFTRDDMTGDQVLRQSVDLSGETVLRVACDMTFGYSEFEAALKATSNVNGALLHPKWVPNHYRWIVYKLAAQDRAFASSPTKLTLTPLNVMNQLKHRYEREFNRCERSAVRKILEGDDIASRFMVLFVSHIISTQTEEQLTVELSDGWYSICAQFDGPLSRLIRQGKIGVGTKLCIFGAELCGCPQPTTPLEMDEDSAGYLKISANSTRRARWDTKLGYQKQRAFPVHLGSLFPDGGLVGCTDVVITRAYPLLYIVKQSDGAREYRSERAFDALRRKVEDVRQEKLEHLLQQHENSERGNSKSNRFANRRFLSKDDVSALGTDGEALYNAMQCDAEQAAFVVAHMSNAQKSALERFTHERKEHQQRQFASALCERDVEMVNECENAIPLFRVRVVDYRAPVPDTSADRPVGAFTITVYRPSRETKDIMKEGQRLIIFGLRSRQSTLQHAVAQMQLNTGRATRYHVMPVKENILGKIYSPRVCAVYSSLPLCEPYEEVDLVGWVVEIGKEYAVEHYDRASVSQKVFLSNDCADILVIEIRGGLKQCGFESIVRMNAVLAISNLVYDCYDAKYEVSVCHTTEQTCISSAPRVGHLKDAHMQLSALSNQRSTGGIGRAARSNTACVIGDKTEFGRLSSDARVCVSKIMSDSLAAITTKVVPPAAYTNSVGCTENTTVCLEESYAFVHPGYRTGRAVVVETSSDGNVIVRLGADSTEMMECPIHGLDERQRNGPEAGGQHYVVNIDNGVLIKSVRLSPLHLSYMLRTCLSDAKDALYDSTYARLMAFVNGTGVSGGCDEFQSLRTEVLKTWQKSTTTVEDLLLRVLPNAIVSIKDELNHVDRVGIHPCKVCTQVSALDDCVPFTAEEWRTFTSDLVAVISRLHFQFTLAAHDTEPPMVYNVVAISNQQYLHSMVHTA